MKYLTITLLTLLVPLEIFGKIIYLQCDDFDPGFNSERLNDPSLNGILIPQLDILVTLNEKRGSQYLSPSLSKTKHGILFKTYAVSADFEEWNNEFVNFITLGNDYVTDERYRYTWKINRVDLTYTREKYTYRTIDRSIVAEGSCLLLEAKDFAVKLTEWNKFKKVTSQLHKKSTEEAKEIFEQEQIKIKESRKF